MKQNMKTVIVAAVAFVTILLSGLATAQQGGLTFFYYDNNGRLSSEVRSDGQVAIYQYDAAGNILGISRTPTPSSISDLSPASGTVGTLVIITGNGFGSVAGDNHVLFNGVPAEIVSANATQIVAKVPTEATSGPIVVIMATSAAISTTPFTVTLPSPVPTITGFAPAVGTPGTAVTITGTNFNATPINDNVAFNISSATVNSASETTIATSVPSGATSGHIRVTTPSGSAVSTADFYVPPPPRTASDVEFTGRMAIGETRTVTINTSGKIGLMLFDGTAGQKVSLLISSSALSGTITILTSSGAVLGGASATTGNFMDARTLPATGTYTIVIAPFVGRTGAATFTLYDVSADAAATIIPGGAPVTLSTTRPGQNASLTFAGVAGQRISVLTSVLPRNTTLTLFDPSSVLLASDTQIPSVPSAWFIDVQRLPVTGIYKIVIDPGGSFVGNITCTVYDVPPDPTAAIAPGGPPIMISTTVPGQNAMLTFDGIAGQRMAFVAVHPGTDIVVAILAPDSTALVVSPSFFDRNFIDTFTLPVSGTYTILLDPARERVGGAIECTLYGVPADITSSITPGGPPVTLTTTVAGQNARLTFNSAPGQRFSLLVQFSSTSPNPQFSIFIRELGGSLTFTQPLFFSGVGFIDTFGLGIQSAGVFEIALSPTDVVTGTFTVTLYDVPPDVVGTITPGGAPVLVTTTVPGQNAKLTLDGVAGQKVSITATGASGFVGEVALRRPDNTPIAGAQLSDPGQDLFIDATVLPFTGTYTISINPSGLSTGSKTFTLYNANDSTGTVAVNGPPVTVNLATPGQSVELSFTATDQPITIHVTNNNISCVTVELIGPDGSGFTGVFVCDGSASFDLDPQTLFAGTYTIRVNPDGAATGSLTVSVTSP